MSWQFVKTIASVVVMCMATVIMTACGDSRTSSGISERPADSGPEEVADSSALQAANRKLLEKTGAHSDESAETMRSHHAVVDKPSSHLRARHSCREPRKGRVWRTGKTYSIKWSSSLGGSVRIAVYTPSWGSDARGIYRFRFPTRRTPNDGVYRWRIPSSYPAGYYSVQVQSLYSPYTVANCAVLKIKKGKVRTSGNLRVTKPNGGETLFIGQKQVIKWTKGRAGKFVRIYMVKGGRIWGSSITTKNDGSYVARVGANNPPGRNYRVKIVSVTNPGIFDYSNRNFTIVRPSDR